MFFKRKFCDPLLVEDAMCADYLLLFAQTTGVVKGCTSTLRWVVAYVQASTNYLVTCGSGYCFIIYSKIPRKRGRNTISECVTQTSLFRVQKRK